MSSRAEAAASTSLSAGSVERPEFTLSAAEGRSDFLFLGWEPRNPHRSAEVFRLRSRTRSAQDDNLRSFGGCDTDGPSNRREVECGTFRRARIVAQGKLAAPRRPLSRNKSGRGEEGRIGIWVSLKRRVLEAASGVEPLQQRRCKPRPSPLGYAASRRAFEGRVARPEAGK